MAREAQYKDGLQQGESKSYFEDGKLKLVTIFITQKEWLSKYFDRKGNLVSDWKIKGKEYSGVYRQYGDRGELEWEYSYEKSVPSGLTKHFGKSGKVDWEYLYKDGKATGDVKLFYESGKLMTRGKWDGKEWRGDYESYYEDGTLQKTRKCESRDKCFVKEFFEDGKIKSESDYKNAKDIVVKKYFQSGELGGEYAYLNNKLNGQSKKYYKSGKLRSEETYKNGVLVGIGKAYFEDGGLKEETTYVHGDRDYDSKEYYKSGKLRGEVHQRGYKPFGSQKSYYENGTIASEMSINSTGGWEAMVFDEQGKVVKSEYDIAAIQLKMAQGEFERFPLLGKAAKEAFNAGLKTEAKQLAEELKGLIPEFKDYNDYNDYGDAIQGANIVLGRIAVSEGKIEDAKKFLLEAGKNPGSPVMSSFGPNMSLAKDLLEKGEKDAVLQYFDLCSKFWKRDDGRLKKWAEEVKGGKIPDFSSNLVY